MSTIQPVRLPRNFKTNVRYHPTKLQIKENADLVSTASMTILESEAPEIHDYLELYTASGSVGVFRVTSIRRVYGDSVTVELAHAIDALSDAIVTVEQEYTGTVMDLLTLILSHQKVTSNDVGYWALGGCDDAGSLEGFSINYESCYDLLDRLAQEETGYYFTFDFAHTPWRVYFSTKPSATLPELRIDRNVIKCEVTRDDSELCTRLYLGVSNPNVGSHNTYTYDNPSSQLVYGIIERHEEMEATARAPANRYAQKYLQEHAEPLYNVEIDGADLYRVTGLLADRMVLHYQVSVILRQDGRTRSYGQREVITKPIISIEHPDAINDPLSVKVTAASRITTGAQQYKETQKNVSKLWGLMIR